MTKMQFQIKKSRFSIKSRFKESNGADGGHSLNQDFTVLIEIYCFQRLQHLQLCPRGNITDWQFKVLNHRNELCRNTQLQIGEVEHLAPELSPCIIDRRKGLRFGNDTQCIPYYKMCDNMDASSQILVEDCPPLSRILQSRFFCKNPSNFIDKNICFNELYEPCKGTAHFNTVYPNKNLHGIFLFRIWFGPNRFVKSGRECTSF